MARCTGCFLLRLLHVSCHTVALCSVTRQVQHWCWCNGALYSVSVFSLNVDQLMSSFVCYILPCCCVFGVSHFDTACWYPSPNNITLYSWTEKVSCFFFFHDLVSFSQNHCFSILCTYLLVIIHSTCSADIISRISLFLLISWLVLLVSSPPWWYDVMYIC